MIAEQMREMFYDLEIEDGDIHKSMYEFGEVIYKDCVLNQGYKVFGSVRRMLYCYNGKRYIRFFSKVEATAK